MADARFADLNKELGSYISQRRKKTRTIGNIFKGSPKREDDVELHPDVKPYTDNKEPELPKTQVLEENETEEFEEMEEGNDEESLEEEYQPEEKVGFFKKIFGGKKQEEEIEDMEEEFVEQDPDLKAISRITLDILKKLPQDDLAEFKNSDDFANFKEILRRNNLIK